jgi:hypothetical protein
MTNSNQKNVTEVKNDFIDDDNFMHIDVYFDNNANSQGLTVAIICMSTNTVFYVDNAYRNCAMVVESIQNILKVGCKTLKKRLLGYLEVNWLVCEQIVGLADVNPKLIKIKRHEGQAGLMGICVEITMAFQEKYGNDNWDEKDWYETVSGFVDEQLEIDNKQYFLLGSDYVNHYDNYGINDLINALRSGDILFNGTCEVFDASNKHMASELLDAYTGWNKFVNITADEYAKFSQFLAEQ